MKFLRRPDLDAQTRMNIVFVVLLCEGTYGAITRLARQYNVSRTFIYELLWTANLALLGAFSEAVNEKGTRRNRRELDKAILLLRLEGNCSIQEISNILMQMGYHPCSPGYISQRLRSYGVKLSGTLEGETIEFVLFLSDELFSNSYPILITIEPAGTTILRIELAEDRTSASWQAHWKEIERNKYYTLGLVSDRGKGLTEGFKAAFEEKPYYPDHFHEFRDLARIILVELEKRAYKAIAYEDERAKVFDSAKSERVQNKRFEAWEKAVEATEQAIEEYEAYTYLFVCIKANPGLFDKGGNLQDKAGVKEEILTALALMKELSYKKVEGIVIKLEEKVDEFLLYFEKAKEVYKRVSAQIENKEVLRALCLAWQWDHKVHQSKGAEQKHFSRQERDFWLAYAEGILGQDIESLKESTFSELDTVVRSSSLVEMVNSLIRPYLNTCKGKITQESLNLIMFYHNHRKFNDGKRKGKAPIEILSGKLLKKHWVDILLDDYGDFQDEESKGEAVSSKSEAIGMACAEALQ